MRSFTLLATDLHRVRRAVLVCMVPCLTGCTTVLMRDDHAVYRTPPERLHEIETVRLERLSQSEPVSIEEAAADATAHAVATEEPPETIELTLAEVRAAALTNNLDLKVELANPSIAHEAVIEQEARFEPFLFGSAKWDRTDRESTIIDGPPQQSRLTSYEAGVRIPLRTGGTATVSLPSGKSDDDSPGSSTPR